MVGKETELFKFIKGDALTNIYISKKKSETLKYKNGIIMLLQDAMNRKCQITFFAGIDNIYF